MSDIKIQPSATGSATVTLTAPATGTARTVTLPDGTGSLIADNGSGSVGIGTSSPDGTVHIHTASAGSVTANADADDLVVENSGHTGINILSPDASRSAIQLGHTSDNLEMQIRHDGATSLTQVISDDPITFNVTDGSESARVTADGITFQGDTAAANALDDYEEGTWTPVLTDLTNNATMHSLNAGVYTKIGRVVHCTANVRTTSLGSVSGNLYLSGFPFSTPNTNGNHGAGSVANAENMSITAGHAITLYYGKNSNSARFDIYDHSGGVTVLQASEWTSDGQATIQVTYST